MGTRKRGNGRRQQPTETGHRLLRLLIDPWALSSTTPATRVAEIEVTKRRRKKKFYGCEEAHGIFLVRVKVGWG